MARSRRQPVEREFVLFDVLYEDGTRTSNRKVPGSEVGGLDKSAFVAPQLDRNALLDRAGRARHPGVAAMCDSYAQLADRVDRNLARISETAAKAAAMVSANVEAQKLALVRASMRAGRPSELGVAG